MLQMPSRPVLSLSDVVKTFPGVVALGGLGVAQLSLAPEAGVVAAGFLDRRVAREGDMILAGDSAWVALSRGAC